MPVPRSFKTDESFLEKIAIGATGTRRVFDHLTQQGHDPIELERGSMSFKIWKAIKIKRVRVPDILCLRCGHRVESRAKTKVEISMSHSTAVQERGWDFGLDDDDRVTLTHCQRSGPGPVDWSASPLVQYIPVASLRQAWRANQAITQRPKGVQEGFEIRVTWPAAIASLPGIVEDVEDDRIRYVTATGRRTARLQRQSGRLTPRVAPGDQVQAGQIMASVVSVSTAWPCHGGASVADYVRLATSLSLSERYTAVKALGRFLDRPATDALTGRAQDTREHIYIRVEAAAGLMRRDDPAGEAFLAKTLHDPYLENRLEAVIVLGEIATPDAAHLLMATLEDTEQHPEIRAGAAWSLGEVGVQEALPALVDSFGGLELAIKIEAARALAKIARRHLDQVLQTLPRSAPEQRPGIAWALGKAGGFTIHQLLPMLVDEDARQWAAYIIGTQEREAMLPDIEALATQDPQVYFAVTVLWKIIASWVYDLEEY